MFFYFIYQNIYIYTLYGYEPVSFGSSSVAQCIPVSVCERSLREALWWFRHFKHGLPFNCSDTHPSQNPARLTWRTHHGWPREASGRLHKVNIICRGYGDYFTRCLDIWLSKLTLWPILVLLENKLPHLLQRATVNFAVAFFGRCCCWSSALIR